MSEEQAEWAVQSLYENPGVRDELSDSEADLLLRWGEEQIMRLAALEMDEASFDAAYDYLAGLLRHINKLAARRAQLPQEDVEVAVNRIAESAVMIGLSVPPEALVAYLQRLAVPNIEDNVRALIALAMSGQPPMA